MTMDPSEDLIVETWSEALKEYADWLDRQVANHDGN